MTDTPTNPTLRRIRLGIWLLAVLAALGLAFLLLRPATPETSRTEFKPAEPGLPGFTLGAPFTLVGSDGKPFSSASLAGKPYAMFFGFTHCPDVCPTTLARLARLRTNLGKGDKGFEILFVSVDPERDTPKVVGDYARLFNTPVIGLTGTREQVDAVAKSHAIYQARVPDKGAPDGYTVDHGAAVLLFGRDGKFVSTIAIEEGDGPALDKLRRIAA